MTFGGIPDCDITRNPFPSDKTKSLFFIKEELAGTKCSKEFADYFIKSRFKNKLKIQI